GAVVVTVTDAQRILASREKLRAAHPSPGRRLIRREVADDVGLDAEQAGAITDAATEQERQQAVPWVREVLTHEAQRHARRRADADARVERYVLDDALAVEPVRRHARREHLAAAGI